MKTLACGAYNHLVAIQELSKTWTALVIVNLNGKNGIEKRKTWNRKKLLVMAAES